MYYFHHVSRIGMGRVPLVERGLDTDDLFFLGQIVDTILFSLGLM